MLSAIVANRLAFAARPATPAFKEDKGDKLMMVGFFAKKARGMMARYMVKNRAQTVDALKDFNEEGYIFQPDLSDAKTFTFTRKSTT